MRVFTESGLTSFSLCRLLRRLWALGFSLSTSWATKSPFSRRSLPSYPLGYVSGAKHSRRILEVSFGVTLGILIGDLLLILLGHGTWQAAVVLFLSVIIARFIDKGHYFHDSA